LIDPAKPATEGASCGRRHQTGLRWCGPCLRQRAEAKASGKGAVLAERGHL